ncbi:hypothetical protein LTR27_010511 [Elasticomyces elasticus]|nr:hypothetical protein LTR27_010511 [Elasticomyces elasticus]
MSSLVDRAEEARMNVPVEVCKNANNMRCRLLELPPELQLLIYELVVIYEKPIKLNYMDCVRYLGSKEADSPYSEDWRAWETARVVDRHNKAQPTLAATCRRIRSIILPVYYKRNIFEACCCYGMIGWDYSMPEAMLRTLEEMRVWLENIGSSNRALLTGFSIHLNIESYYCRKSDSDTMRALVNGMDAVVVSEDCCESGGWHRLSRYHIDFPDGEAVVSGAGAV